MRKFETRQEQQQRFIKCKVKLKKLLDDCLEKQLSFNINPTIKNISIFKIFEGEFIFNFDCFYFGDLSETKGYQTIPLDELMQKVKDYKNINE